MIGLSYPTIIKVGDFVFHDLFVKHCQCLKKSNKILKGTILNHKLQINKKKNNGQIEK